jgi:small-conductance mechanosensitive channel
MSSIVLAQEQSNVDQNNAAKQDKSISSKGLAEIIPKAAKLSGDLAILENRVTHILDISEFEKKYATIEENLKGFTGQLKQIEDSKDSRSYKLMDIRKVIDRENELLEEINEPLNRAIRQIEEFRVNWQAEKQKWNQWKSILLEDRDLPQLNLTLEKANDTIDKALGIANSQLNSMLTVQQRAASIQAKIFVLRAKLDALVSAARSSIRIHLSPPIFSSQYFSQFSSELWYELYRGLDQLFFPDRLFFERHGVIIFLQVFFTVSAIIVVFRFRRALTDSKRWFFLAARPFSTGLWFGTMIFMLFYEYRGTQDTWSFVLLFIGGISFARLISALYPKTWKRRFVYALLVAWIITKLLLVIMMPLPLFRLYIILTASVGLIFSWRCASESMRQKDSGVFRWLLRLGAIFLAFIVIAEILGKKGLGGFLYVSLMRSAGVLLGFMLFLYMINGLIEWAFRSSPFKQSAVFSGNTEAIVRTTTISINAAICGLVLLPVIFVIWGVYDDLQEAIKSLLTLGINLGSNRISVSMVIVSAGILYGSFFVSRFIQKLLVDQVLASRRVEKGVSVSIARLFHYAFISIGFLMALLALGFEITKLTIILSALGVGIGFGLQGVVNNFVSGLILLFERPVRVGDYIEIGGNWAEIHKIGLRATTVQTFDQADVIIPNADLITNQVTNWTLSNRRVRLAIPVGVAYGSDVALVMETLMACAKTNSNVAETPPAQVLFLSFGENSLDFELRVWVLDADNKLVTNSELHQEIDKRFREAKIEIAFPQMDLHLRGVDEPGILKRTEALV